MKYHSAFFWVSEVGPLKLLKYLSQTAEMFVSAYVPYDKKQSCIGFTSTKSLDHNADHAG